MLTLTEIKTGKKILYNGDPHLVLSDEHSKMGRAGAVLRTKLRNLITGVVFEKTFQGADRVDEATVEKKPAQFLYTNGDEVFFMDLSSYEQFTIAKRSLERELLYLTEGTEVVILTFNDRPISVELPIKVELEVVETAPNFKGNTAGGGKPAKLITGVEIVVPFFIEVGDVVVVNTERNEYVGKK